MTTVERHTAVQKINHQYELYIHDLESICFSHVVAVHSSSRSFVDPQCLRPGSLPPALDKRFVLRNQAGLVEVVMDGCRAAERTLNTLLPAALHRAGKCSLDLNCTEKRALQVR